MENQKILLINSPNPSQGNNAGNYSAFPSLGVVALGTAIKYNFPGLEVKVIDGGTKSTGEIEQVMNEYKPGVTCLSVLTTTYNEGLKLAEYAKNNFDSKVILGNDHASFFPEIILDKRGYVDYVVKAEFGEKLLLDILNCEFFGKKISGGKGPEKIYMRSPDGKIISASSPKPALEKAIAYYNAVPDISLLIEQLPDYVESYNNKYGKFHSSKRIPFVINNVRGCGNGEYRCTYCSIYDLGLSSGKSEQFWQIVKRQNEEYGINFFFEVCDSFLTFRKYIKKLIETMPFDPKDKDIEFEVYARANDVVNMKDSIQMLKKLNVTRVNLGLDSGDDNMLKMLRKRNKDNYDGLSSSMINYEAVRKLAEEGITIHASFPLGSLGETKNSLKSTVSFIERMAKDFEPYLATLEASELVPLPDSPCWDMLLGNNDSKFTYNGGLDGMLKEANVNVTETVMESLREKHSGMDLLDTDLLVQDWVKNFTHVDWQDIEEAKREVQKIAEGIGAVYGRAI